MPMSADEIVPFKWASDGKSVLYVKHENGVGNIWSFSLAGGKPKKLTDFRSDEIYAFDISPDNRLIVSRGNRIKDLVVLEGTK